MSELRERTARMEQSLHDLHKKIDDLKPFIDVVHSHNVEIAKIHRDKWWERGIFGTVLTLFAAWIEHK